MGQQPWTYKNYSEPSLTGINPLKNPLEYLRMINDPINTFQLRMALLDGNSILSKKETEIISQAEENRISIILISILEYIEIQRERNKEKEEMIGNWRAQQLAGEAVRRQFDPTNDMGKFKQFDHHDLSTLQAGKIGVKMVESIIELKKINERILVLEEKLEQLKAQDVVINQEWRQSKAETLNEQIQEFEKHNYVMKVLERDENGQAIKHQRPIIDKDGKEVLVSEYVFRDVKVSSEEGKKVLDVYGVLPSSFSDKEDKKAHKTPKEEFTLTRRLDALLLSYDITPDPLLNSKRSSLAPLDPTDTDVKMPPTPKENVSNAELLMNIDKKPPPAPKAPPTPPQKQSKPDRIKINMEEFFKREQLNDAFEVLFVKTRGGVRIEEKVMITSTEMLALLKAENGANKFIVQLQHKPSPATLQNLTEALQNALVKQEVKDKLIAEKADFDNYMKETAKLAKEFVHCGYPGVDIMKAIKGSKAEQEEVISQMLTAIKQQSQLMPGPQKG